MHQIRFRPEPDPAGGAYDAHPGALVGWEGGYPLPITNLIDGFGVSVYWTPALV